MRKKGGGGRVPSKLPSHGKITAAPRANLPFRQIALFLLVFAAAALCTFAQTPTPQAPPQAATPQAATPQAATIEYAVLPREAIEGRLLRSTHLNIDRQAILQQIFEEAGCGGDNLTAQPIKRGKFVNVICTLPGTGDSVIVIGAHFDHAAAGDGVVDNWSGASLLPSLFASLHSAPRKHTIVFIGFAEEEEGLAGSNFYVKEIPREQVAKIHAMINLDSLGLGPTNVWLTHSDLQLADRFNAVASLMKLPLGVVNADKAGDEDSTPFRKRGTPTLVVHSITQQTLPILHTPNDTIEKIDTAAYYDTYRLLACFLATLDAAID